MSNRYLVVAVAIFLLPSSRLLEKQGLLDLSPWRWYCPAIAPFVGGCRPSYLILPFRGGMVGKHEDYMRLALQEAEAALAVGDFPVGCVMVSDGEVVVRGRRQNSSGESTNELDHAEIVALRRLFETRPDIAADSVVVYSTMEPCLMCYVTMLLNGIRQMVYAYEDVMGGGTNLPLGALNPLYREMEVSVVHRVLRDESLGLFQQFFARPDNGYWADSQLARYTMAQGREGGEGKSQK